MTTVAMSEFRARLSHFMQKVQDGEILSITQRGTEIARLVPPSFIQLSARKRLAELQKTAFVGDVLSPLDADWEVMQ